MTLRVPRGIPTQSVGTIINGAQFEEPHDE